MSIKTYTLADFPANPNVLVARPDWVCSPCGVTDSSDELEDANFDALLEMLHCVDPEEKDSEAVVWPVMDHYAMWVFARPGTPAAEVMVNAADTIASQFVLDPERYQEYLNTAAAAATRKGDEADA